MIVPVCYVTLSQDLPDLLEGDRDTIRDIVAEELDSGARALDRTHIVLRVQRGRRTEMLGEVEVEVFAQFFVRRFFNRDRRAQRISRRVAFVLGSDCATWINMSVVGYSRVTTRGDVYFSD